MKKLITILLLSIITVSAIADTIQVNRRLSDLEHTVKQIDSNQLNYKIEKDLLKETYSNNYEKISLVITLILGVMGVLGYLGLKDITTIRKEYEQELNNLRTIQGQFEFKSNEFDKDKKKFEDEIKIIIKENEEQSRKIKFIELKDKVRILLKDNNLTSALEFANTALQIYDADTDLLNQKGRILCRLNQFKDAVEAFNAALKINPKDNTIILNTAECLYFAKEIENAKKLIADNKSLFESKDNGRLMDLFSIIEMFYDGKKDELLALAKSYINIDNLNIAVKKIKGWDLQEALFFVHYQEDCEIKSIIQNIIWYWDGQMTGEKFLTKLGIELPTA